MPDRTDKTSRLKKSIRLTAILAVLIAIPLGTLVYFRLTRGTSVRDYGKVLPFVAKDAGGTYFDHTQLANHVTVVALFPPSCDGPNALKCQQMMVATKTAGEWLETQLAAEVALQANTRPASGAKPKTPVQRLVVLPGGQDMATAAADPVLRGWRLFQNQDFSHDQIVPGDPKVTAAGFYAVDPMRHFRAAFPLNPDGNPEWNELKAALSRLTMNLYFNDYLSKRTFFGPAKEKNQAGENLK
ncbi:MAG: hypothetical protein RIQ81_1917 [Pseudomonadota bacterium]